MVSGTDRPGGAAPVERLGSVEDLSRLLAVADRSVVVCFTGSWCGSCSLFGPVFEAVAGDLAGVQRVFAVVDTQEVPALATPYLVRTVPTVVVLRGGVVVGRVDGPVTARELTRRVRQT